MSKDKKKAAPAATETGAKAAKRGKRGNPAYAPKAAAPKEVIRLVIMTPQYSESGQLAGVTFVEGNTITSQQAEAIMALSPVGTLQVFLKGEILYGVAQKTGLGKVKPIGESWGETELLVPPDIAEIVNLGRRRMAAVARRQATNRAADVGKQHAGKSSLRDAFQALVDKGV